MLFEKRKLVSWTAGAVLATGLAAGGLVSSASAQQAADIEVAINQVAVYADTVANFDAMNVRIADPDGNLVVDARSAGEPVVWGPSAGDPDGLYRYEVVVIMVDPAAAASDEEDAGESLNRQNGSFEVIGGTIVVREEDDSSLWRGALRFAGAVLDAIGEAIIPSARAQDVQIDDATPGVCFNDTDLTANPAGCSSASANTYWIWGEGNQSGGFLNVYNLQQSHSVIDIQNSTNDVNTLTGDDNGDVGLADNTVFIDRSADRVGIGTTMPADELQINAASPAIRFLDETVAGGIASVEYDGGALFFEGRNGQDIFRVSDQAPLNALRINAAGRVGVGTGAPASALEVRRSDGTSQILVDENAASAANRQLLRLENNGNPQIELNNVATGVNWRVGMGPANSFFAKKGSRELRFTEGGGLKVINGGDTVFDLRPSGNLVIDGNLTQLSDAGAKHDVTPLDEAEVLAQVAALPVSAWSYKDDETGARHAGPMAQDFRAAFGLGEDDTHISPMDAVGVALAAIKALQQEGQHKDAEIRALRTRLEALERKLAP